MKVREWPKTAELGEVFWMLTVRRKTGPKPCTYTGDRQTDRWTLTPAD